MKTTRSQGFFYQMKIINFILYGNFFIAFCAYAQTAHTSHILGYNNTHILSIFVASATFFLYNIHKPITYILKKQLIDNQRFLKTKSFSTPLSIFTIFAGIVCFYLFFELNTKTQVSLILAAALSLTYVLPILGGRRLRDFPFVKIFTIAFVWAFVTVILPVQEYGQFSISPILPIFSEKILFIFALTIPFDIRDVDWDTKTNVKTIPLSIGIQNAKKLGILSLVGSIYIVFNLKNQDTYASINATALLLTYLTSIFIIAISRKDRSDYFFYGLTDGMLLLPSFLSYLLNLIV